MKALQRDIRLGSILRDVRLNFAVSSGEFEAAEREKALSESYEKGRRDREKELLDDLSKEKARLSEVQSGVLDSLRTCVPSLIQHGERALTRMAVEVAEKVLSGLPISSEMVEANIKAALKEVHETSEVSVQVHPEDLQLLEASDSLERLQGDKKTPLQFKGSQKIDRGGCVLMTPFGVIDGQRSTKLRILKEALHA